MDWKLFNYIIIIIFICNYIFIHFGVHVLISIWILLLCIFFTLFFRLNFAKINFKNFAYILIIFKKVINISSLLILFLNSNPNWMLYVNYIIENGLEDNEKVNEAVDGLGLTEKQKFYLKIGCVITGVIFSIIFGYYISQNYEIFKPVENSDTASVASVSSEDLNIDAISIASGETVINIINDSEETVFTEITEIPQTVEAKPREEVIYIIGDSEEAVLLTETPQEIVQEIPQEIEPMKEVHFDNLLKNIKKQLADTLKEKTIESMDEVQSIALANFDNLLKNLKK